MSANRNWVRVSRESPCPVCKKDRYCSLSADGTVAKCMFQEAGAFKSKEDKNGARYHLHRLADGPRPEADIAPRPPGSEAKRADPDTLHAVYSALLERLTLSKTHREALNGRGLADDAIARGGYRSLPGLGRPRIARSIRECLGDKLLRVPGFVVKEGRTGRYLTLRGPAGLLVPCRDRPGRIVALKVRLDETSEDKPRYVYVSSAEHGGPGPGAPVHCPVGMPEAAELIRATEGELKSDIAQALTGLPTLSVPGVGNWRPALAVLKAMDVKTVRLAIDRDAHDKPHVASALAALAEGLAVEGFAVELEAWPDPHQGIDDALVAGVAIDVLAGDDARRAIAAIVAEATAGEPLPEPSPLDRLAEVLAEGGAQALFRDGELLQALARLAEDNPAEFACRRARLQCAGVKLRDLDRALSKRRQEIRRERPPLDAAGCYRMSGGRIVRDVMTKEGPVETPLANWSGRIAEEVMLDDGAEHRIMFAVEGALADGTPLPRAEVRADQFAWMRWPVEIWGTRAVVLAGAGTADHLRCALQLLSGDVPRRTVYGHTGWRMIGDRWHYLYAGGAIGPEGSAENVEVSLSGALSGFALPEPPEGENLANAVRASLTLLDGLTADRLVFPLLGGVYRAALGEAPGPIDLSLYLAGPHAVGKSELAALCQQHFGAGLDARHLPGSWSSTANALERLAFSAKDALLVVDDYAPRGAAGDRQRLEREADRLLRAQGNKAGRGRMRADGTLWAERPPRGLILSTGEDVPPGQSLRGRMMTLEVSPGDVPLARLTAHQQAAAAGLFAQALAGFVRWLAPQYGELCGRLPAERAALRDRAITGTGSARTPGIVADLALGLKYFLDFARTAGTITDAQRNALARRGWQALREAGAAQADHIQASEPTGLFLRLLAAAIASGRAHVAGISGTEPPAPEAWGWRCRIIGTGEHARDEWQPQGQRVGWIDGTDLYLEPSAAYAEAQELARQQAEALPVSARTLWRRLREQGLLATWDQRRKRYTVRRTLEKVKDREVIHLRDTVLSCAEPSEPSADVPGCCDSGDNPADSNGPGTVRRDRNRPPEPSARTTEPEISADGFADGSGDHRTVAPGNRPQEKPAKSAESSLCGRFGRSAEGIEGVHEENFNATNGEMEEFEL